MILNQEKIRDRMIEACPVVTRDVNGAKEVLVFHHPEAGVQFVKGTIEKGETVLSAALRELHEESGIRTAMDTEYLGMWQSEYENQEWHFVHCHCENLAESWRHYTQDDGGHYFNFFWHSINSPSNKDWYEVYERALLEIRYRLSEVVAKGLRH